MKRLLLVPLAIFLSLFLLAGSASAVLVELQDEAMSWSAGETLSFTFDSSEVLPSDGTGGSFYIHARGDFFNKTPLNYSGQPDVQELIDIDIDGIVVVNGFYLLKSDPGFLVWDPETDHNEWEYTWSINPADMLAITADQAAEIVIDLYMGVKASGAGDFVKVDLSYNAVPIPGSLLLLGSGVLGLIGIRRKIFG
jgi:hypothetical protein